MLEAERQQILSELASCTKDQLLELLVTKIDENQTLKAHAADNEKVYQQMALDYAAMKDENAGLKEENTFFKQQNEHLTSIAGLQAKALFGRSSEKSADIRNEDIPDDPVSEDASEIDLSGSNTQESAGQTDSYGSGRKHGSTTSGRHGRRGRRPIDLSKLPHRDKYDLDAARIAELNAKYGEGNWRVVFWRWHNKVERLRPLTYVETTYEPVIAHGSTGELEALPYPTDILPGSILSNSLAVSFMYGKFGMGLPFKRQIKDLETDGLFLTEQTVTFWAQKLAEDYLNPVRDYMILCLKGRPYNQCDETTQTVICDGRSAGSKSYIWVHVTSELDEKPPIVVFCYEKTRSAQHLRDFYGKHSRVRVITCDAYSAYQTYEKELGGNLLVTGCLMHARRRFANALALVNTKGMSQKQIDALPESRGLALIAAIYHEEGRLKSLTASERLRQRQEKVLPLVNRYFDFVHSFNQDDPALSEKLRDALAYSINQEPRLRQFLNDGTIPCDDGFTERRIRPYAVGRRSWLFNFTPSGAEAAMTYYTLIETARLNGANPYIYLTYLLEKMPELVPFRTDQKHMRDMMPWSRAYRQYEKAELGRTMERYLPDSDVKPASPRMARRKRSVA